MAGLIGGVTYERIAGKCQSVYGACEKNRVVEKVEGVAGDTYVAVIREFLFQCGDFRDNADYCLTELVV